MMLSCLLVGCGSILLQGGPDASANVYGNGGSAVVKGDYLYFANAYIDYNNLSINDNNYDDKSPFKTYAIYRTRLTEDGRISTDADGNPKGAEILTYNIGGFSYSGLYIFGNYLYYATPFSRSNQSGSTSKGLVRFERVKLNGEGHETLYSEESFDSSSSYKMVYADGNVYIVIFCSSKVRVIKCNSNGGYNTTPYEIASDVKSFAVFENKNIINGQSLNDVNKYVYYVKQDSTTNFYTLYRKPLANGGEEAVVLNKESELSLVDVKNDRIYYTEGNILKSYSYGNLSVESIKTYSNFEVSSSGANKILSYKILDDSEGFHMDRGVLGVYYDGTTYFLKVFNGDDSLADRNRVSYAETEIKILGTQKDEIYVQKSEDTSLYLFNFVLNYIEGKFVLQKQDVVPQTIATNFSVSSTGIDMFDYDDSRIFVYEKTGETDYLSCYVIEGTVESEKLGQVIGIVKDEDKKKED